MNKPLRICSLAILFSFLAFSSLPAVDFVLNKTPAQVYFSPNGGGTEAIVKEIDGAKTEVLVQAYSFTSVPIAKALLNAHKRGVKIEAILDKSQRKEKYTSATFLANSGIPTYIDDKHAIAHNKIMIVDRTTVITGSFNFTKAAEEKNAENLLIIASGGYGQAVSGELVGAQGALGGVSGEVLIRGARWIGASCQKYVHPVVPTVRDVSNK
jgi:phosphatidylserine/phosphatidylglycerophosphate/cardiolipin synthase-like enzyme